MPDLGSAYVNIVPKAPGIESKVEGLLNGGGGGATKAGTSLGKKLLGGIAALGIGAAVGKMLKESFEAGGALQQSFGGLETIYGEKSAKRMKMFAEAAAAYGVSANDYAEQAVSFGASLKQAFGGDTSKAMLAANTAIRDMADNAAKMGTPIESIQTAYQGFAKQNYTMLDNLKLGYGGTKEEMERLLADAQKITGVEYDIKNLGDVYNAIHVIQGELGLTGVAAGEAETTLTGSMGAVKASWENVMAALTTGEGLDAAMANMSTSLGNFATNVLTMFNSLLPQIPGLITGLADMIIEHAPDLMASGAELIVQLIVGFVAAIPKIFEKLPEIIDGIINAFRGVDWAQLGRDIINGIVQGLASTASHLWNKMKEIVRGGLKSAQDEAQTGSPSRLFADELGRWIPAGVAMGIDENMAPLDRAMQGMVDGSLANAQGFRAKPAAAAANSDADRIISALAGLQLQANVSLEGDARRLFRVVNDTNRVRTRATNYNALAAGG